jgi:hypothetical protein
LCTNSKNNIIEETTAPQENKMGPTRKSLRKEVAKDAAYTYLKKGICKIQPENRIPQSDNSHGC